jgi:chemotaxis protein MotA
MKRRVDWTILLGVFVGLAAIVCGAWFDGLNLTFLWHPTAALIVGGGTIGAVIVRRGGIGVINAFKAVWSLRYKDDDQEMHKVELARLAWLSRSAQKHGVKAFENFAETTHDPLIAQGLLMVAERADALQIREILTKRLNQEQEEGLEDAATWEAAGGFAPTFGILGAVLGLIGVLRVLDQPGVLGIGIATAFVATIYGIGFANLLFFPLASRLRARHESHMKRRDELATVILALQTRDTPRAIINQFNMMR